MDSDLQRIKGVVGEVGLERDGERFNAFNVTISIVVNTRRILNFNQGEQLINEFRKELLGKAVEITVIVVPCPVCGKGFNTEQGMRQHVRMVHEKKAKPKGAKRARKKSSHKK